MSIIHTAHGHGHSRDKHNIQLALWKSFPQKFAHWTKVAKQGRQWKMRQSLHPKSHKELIKKNSNHSKSWNTGPCFIYFLAGKYSSKYINTAFLANADSWPGFSEGWIHIPSPNIAHNSRERWLFNIQKTPKNHNFLVFFFFSFSGITFAKLWKFAKNKNNASVWILGVEWTSSNFLGLKVLAHRFSELLQWVWVLVGCGCACKP
jgi:hypothetical protein